MSSIEKLSPGPWTFKKAFGLEEKLCFHSIHDRDGNYVASTWAQPQEFNAALIAEAGTVATETGLTPRQLSDALTAANERIREMEAQAARDEEHYQAAMAMSEKHRKLWVEECQKHSNRADKGRGE